jgi:large subunit ribosomal protein L22
MEAVAKLKNYPTSPRKMRLLADLIRGMAVENAIAVSGTSSKASGYTNGKVAKKCNK